MSSPRLSAIVPTLNEADNLPACLDSLAWADEVIVIDSGSTDATAEIARRHGATVIERPFDGYGAQRNHAVAAARHDWVLCVDADERVPEELRREIAETLGAPRHPGYRVPRQTWVAGHRIRRCGWQRDRVLRLYDRRRGAWDARLVHEKVVLDGAGGGSARRFITTRRAT